VLLGIHRIAVSQTARSMFNKIITEISRGKVFPWVFLFCYSMILPLAFIKQNQTLIKIAWWMSFVLGLILILHGIVTSIDAHHSKNWPRTKASLKECFVRHWKSDHIYDPIVKYEFWVKGQKYTGTNIDFSDASGSEAAAREKIDRIKSLEQNLYVYYKPANPTLSVIEPGFRFIHPLRFIFGCILSIVSILSITGIVQY